MHSREETMMEAFTNGAILVGIGLSYGALFGAIAMLVLLGAPRRAVPGKPVESSNYPRRKV